MPDDLPDSRLREGGKHVPVDARQESRAIGSRQPPTGTGRDSAVTPSDNAEHDAFAALDADQTLARLNTSETGLDSQEAARRLAQYGPNLLAESHTPLWRQLAEFFWGPIPWMIEAAGVLSAVNQDWQSFGVIVAMLLINGGIGFWQEKSASDALDALKQQLALKARVRRDGTWQEIDASQLVPGDVVRLRLGDIVPADVKLLDDGYLSIDQSALTGESLPVTRKRDETAYSSTAVKEGEMVAVVYATGGSTFFGRTASLVQSAGAVSHFQRAVLHIGNILVVSAVALSVLLTVLELDRGLPLLTLLSFVLIVVRYPMTLLLPGPPKAAYKDTEFRPKPPAGLILVMWQLCWEVSTRCATMCRALMVRRGSLLPGKDLGKPKAGSRAGALRDAGHRTNWTLSLLRGSLILRRTACDQE